MRMHAALADQRQGRHAPGERGAILVVVLVVMLLVAAFLVASGTAVANLRRELRLVEHAQLVRYGTNLIQPPPPASTRVRSSVPLP